MVDRLSPADAEHFEEVRRLLDGAAIDYELDPRLVRGLDYYTRTVFEFRCDALGAQSGIGGGGRYDAPDRAARRVADARRRAGRRGSSASRRRSSRRRASLLPPGRAPGAAPTSSSS